MSIFKLADQVKASLAGQNFAAPIAGGPASPSDPSLQIGGMEQQPQIKTPAGTTAPATGGATYAPSFQAAHPNVTTGGNYDQYGNYTVQPKPAAAPASATFGPTSNWADPSTVSAYFQSRNTTPNGTTPQYWADEWNKWGKNDPAYFWQRIQTADEFGGGGASGGNEFSDKWGSSLEDLVANYLGQTKTAADNARTNGKTLSDTLNARAAELEQTPYTAGDEATMRAQATDQFEQRRQQTLKNNREQLYLRGFAPTSGLAVGSDESTNRSFDAGRTAIDSGLLASSLAEGQRRKDQATQLKSLATQALNGGDTSAIQYYADQLGAAEAPLNLEQTREASALAASNPGGTSSALSTILSILSAGQAGANGTNTANANNAAGLAALLKIYGLA